MFFEALIPYLRSHAVQRAEMRNWVVSGSLADRKLGQAITLPAKVSFGISSVTLLGLTIQTRCSTVEPLALNLTTTLTREALLSQSWSFEGTTALPVLRCEGGFLGRLFGFVLSSLLSGPENPYAIEVSAPAG